MTDRCTDSQGCPWPASMAVSTIRTTKDALKTTVFYDLEDAPKKATRLCRAHGRALVDALITTLVPIDGSTVTVQ